MDSAAAAEAIAGAKWLIPDGTVRRALRAYESLPAGSGREERMRVALAEVTRKKDV